MRWLGTLRDPYKSMVIVAMRTGLRVSEVLALRWEHMDINAGTMFVQQGVVNGRIGTVKTEASYDELSLDPSFADILLKLKGDRLEGLVFPSHVTDRSLLDESGTPIGVQQKLMRHANVATTMNVYGNSTLRAKQAANSKVVQIVMKHEVA